MPWITGKNFYIPKSLRVFINLIPFIPSIDKNFVADLELIMYSYNEERMVKLD